jgi:hypothetical protein
MDPIYSKAGNIIEPKVRDYVVEQLNCKYKTYKPETIG